MGDASNLVSIIAGELLRKAEHLLRLGLHPSDIVQGYEVALGKTLEIIEGKPSGSRSVPDDRSC